MPILREYPGSASFPHHPVQHESGTPILDVSNLSVNYETGSVLTDISFQLKTSERVAVVGPNGAGKTTLFKVIAGILPGYRGSVKVFGQGPGRHICIAYVPQRNQVDWDFPVSVADVVMMGRVGKLGLIRWPTHKDWNLVHEALSEVGLENLARRKINTLSGGQQQRMFIARALAQEAELILMDEPFTGLDLNSQESIFHVMDDLSKREVTMMISTHDLVQAGERFTRVMLINRRLLGMGTPEEIFTAERLKAAYGKHLKLVQAGDDFYALADTCCDEGKEDYEHH